MKRELKRTPIILKHFCFAWLELLALDQLVLLLLPFMTINQIFDHYCFVGWRSLAKETVETHTHTHTHTHKEVYIKLDTLELKVPREGAWVTSGGSLIPDTNSVKEESV